MPKKKKKTYKEIMAELLKPKETNKTPIPVVVGGGVPEKVIKI